MTNSERTAREYLAKQKDGKYGYLIDTEDGVNAVVELARQLADYATGEHGFEGLRKKHAKRITKLALKCANEAFVLISTP